MNETREQTCAERIGAQLEGRADDVRKMLAVQDPDNRVCENCGQVIWRNGTDDEWVGDGVCRFGNAPTHQPDQDYTEDSLSEFGLSLERKVTFKFLMSTGGPADWLEITCDESRQTDRHPIYSVFTIERVTYHFADWFDHAEQVVTDGPLFELAEWIVEGQS